MMHVINSEYLYRIEHGRLNVTRIGHCRLLILLRKYTRIPPGAPSSVKPRRINVIRVEPVHIILNILKKPPSSYQFVGVG